MQNSKSPDSFIQENRGGVVNQWGKEQMFDKQFWNYCLSIQEKDLFNTLDTKQIYDVLKTKIFQKKRIIEGKNFLNKAHAQELLNIKASVPCYFAPCNFKHKQL